MLYCKIGLGWCCGKRSMCIIDYHLGWIDAPTEGTHLVGLGYHIGVVWYRGICGSLTLEYR